jgi:hypothetical protein
MLGFMSVQLHRESAPNGRKTAWPESLPDLFAAPLIRAPSKRDEMQSLLDQGGLGMKPSATDTPRKKTTRLNQSLGGHARPTCSPLHPCRIPGDP